MDNIIVGFNATALAYGVTGTGKTHTMFGDIYATLNFEKGICMYAIDHLFDSIRLNAEKTFRVKINYLEIYNEQVIDLLVDRNDPLMIVEDPHKGIMVPEITEFSVTHSEQVVNLLLLGNSRRTMAPTGGNQFSSRSHAILQVNVEQRTKTREKEEYITAKLLLVDLAGSERGALEKGIRREEGANINKSLLALGNCINILSDKTKKGSFVPYRDSKLTRLLKDSLGGNISTIMIACISPAPLSYDETLNTLKYASRARKIQKKITRNVKEIDPFNNQYREIIDTLKTEIVQLKDIIKNQNILLRTKPIDSFREDFINLNLNLNLNINNNNQNNDGNHHYEKMKEWDIYKRSMHSIDVNNNSNSNAQNTPVKNNINNFESYEAFLNKNFNNLTDEDFEEFEKKLEKYTFIYLFI